MYKNGKVLNKGKKNCVELTHTIFLQQLPSFVTTTVYYSKNIINIIL